MELAAMIVKMTVTQANNLWKKKIIVAQMELIIMVMS